MNERDVRVRIIGVGGVGGRLAARIGQMGLPNVDIAAVDTCRDSLARLGLPWTVPIGSDEVAVGTGKRPELGVKAAESAGPEIENLVAGGRIAVLIASFGGGTGAGAAPIIAGRLHRAGAVAIVVGIEPFAFEGKARREAARKASDFAAQVADCMVLVPGHASGSTCQPLSFAEMIRTINEQVANAVSSLASIIVQPGAFELDMGDVGRVLAKSGYAAVGFGRGSGPYAAVEAVRAACSSSLLDVQQLAASQSVLLHLAAGDGVSTSEIEQAAALFSRLSAAGDFVFGVITRPELSDAAEATVICSGFAADDLPGLEAIETQTDLEPARDPDAFYYDGQNIDIPTFLRRSRMGRSVAAVV